MSNGKIAAAVTAVVGGVVVAFPTFSLAADVDVVELTAKDVADGLAGGTFTSVDLVESFQKRIALFEPNYNAFVSFNANAVAEAAALDAEYKLTGPRSPLHGVPIVIKEAMDVKGVPSTAGYAPYSSQTGGVDLIPQTDAPLVARLRAAGAVILGKTNIPAFSADGTRANSSWAGPTLNSYDRTLAPGASSSGSATAVSGNLAVLGTAEETGGSIQNPAGAQSLIGIKPTFGLVPNAGIAPLAGSTRDVAGPLAKTVYDAAVTLDIIAGYTAEDPKTVASIGNLPAGGYTSKLSDSALQGKRIGLYGPGWRASSPTPETQALYDTAIAELVAQGATVVADPFAGSEFASLAQAQFGFDSRGIESIAYDLEKYLERGGIGTGENRLEWLKEATGVDAFAPGEPLAFTATLPQVIKSFEDPDVPPDLSDFAAAREKYLAVYNAILDAAGIDALAFPQMLKPTPKVDSTDAIDAPTVSEINILGTPGVTVPAGYYSDGSPFSLLFMGRLFDEANLLGYAYDYEQATMLRVTPNMVAVPLPPVVWAGGATMVGGLVLRRVRRSARAA